MPLLSLAGISFCLDMVSGDHQNRWIQFILLHSFYSPPRASCFSSNRQRWRYTEARDGTAPLAIQPADQAKWKKLGGPLFMRLGKCVLLKEADSLLGYTDGILRDLKDAEMAIREIKSTWHDTARGVAYHPAPPAPQPSLTPRARWRPFSVPPAALPSPAISEAPRTSPTVRAQGGTAIVGGILFLGIAPAMSSACAASVTVP